MATVYVSEYYLLGTDVLGRAAQAPKEPALAEQNVAITGSSTQSAPFQARTNFVRIETDSICSIAFGPNPTAVATAKRFAANQTEYFAVNSGDKVAVIVNV